MKSRDYSQIAGHVEVEVSAYDVGDSRAHSTADGGHTSATPLGHHLGKLLERVTDGKGYVTDPFRGDKHPIDFGQFAGMDPERTYLRFKFKFIPDDKAAFTAWKRQAG